MTPSQVIVQAASGVADCSDSDGRRLQLRKITALDKIRLFKAVGTVLAQNEPYLGMAVLAYSVVSIEGVPVPAPCNEAQIEALVARLGDVGLAAVAASLSAMSAESAQPAREFSGN